MGIKFKYSVDILEKYEVTNDIDENGERPLVTACGRKSGEAARIAVLLIEEMVIKFYVKMISTWPI